MLFKFNIAASNDHPAHKAYFDIRKIHEFTYNADKGSLTFSIDAYDATVEDAEDIQTITEIAQNNGFVKAKLHEINWGDGELTKGENGSTYFINVCGTGHMFEFDSDQPEDCIIQRFSNTYDNGGYTTYKVRRGDLENALKYTGTVKSDRTPIARL